MKLLELNNAKLISDGIDCDKDEGQKSVSVVAGSVIIINPSMILDIKRVKHSQKIRDYNGGKLSLSVEGEMTLVRVTTNFSLIEYLVYQDLNEINSRLHLI